jgi:hypothetical protein
VAHTALLLLAGGRIGLAGAVLWSVAFGCLAAALLVALAPSSAGEDDTGEPHEWPGDREPIKSRGPLSYAGPGSLAEMGTDWGDTRFARIPKSASAEGACLPASVGTESALRR